MTSSTYEVLENCLERRLALSSIEDLLGWDEQVFLPAASADARQEQLAAIAKCVHLAETDPQIEFALGKLEAALDELDEEQRVVVRLARKDFERATRLPDEFVERKARLASASYHGWTEARQKSDFAAFEPFLAQQIDLAKEEATLCGWGDRPYDYHIDRHDPGMDAATIDALFCKLQPELAAFLEEVLSRDTNVPDGLLRGFDTHAQETILRDIVAELGFNFERGRIDRSVHPFCSGNGADIRMTTRFHEDNPLDSLFSSIHETGHALYEQGLPLAHRHNALGQAAGMGAHESQSRFWENQVCRSRAFWKRFDPRYRAAFADPLRDVSPEALYRSVNRIARTPIRTDADEVSYNLHIIIRFEIEKGLFAGEIATADLPAIWNDRYRKLLDVSPKDDAEGCLQDVHWSEGMFGYFPSYCLGNLFAAQIWFAMREALRDLDRCIETADFAPLLAWLQRNIYRHGRRYPLPELCQKATGHPLGTQALMRYLRERYVHL